MYSLVSGIKVILFVWVLLYIVLATANRPSTATAAHSAHVAKCQEYRKSVFEESLSYSPLVVGAAEVIHVIDTCVMYAPVIVGGRPALPKEFPHMARLGHANTDNETQWFCGGTLISRRYVLTAAHCFYSRQGELNRVRLGELHFNSTTDDARPEDFLVQRFIPHPDYNITDVYNDIGLVQLDRFVTLSAYIVPACLPDSRGDQYTSFVAAGWGATKFAGYDSNMLYKVSLDRFSFEQCQEFVNESFGKILPRGLEDDSQICAGSEQARDTCHGDSGGPLLQYHENLTCMFHVVGITSAGLGCGSPGVPGLYTRVFNYLTWIKGIIWRNSGK